MCSQKMFMCGLSTVPVHRLCICSLVQSPHNVKLSSCVKRAANFLEISQWANGCVNDYHSSGAATVCCKQKRFPQHTFCIMSCLLHTLPIKPNQVFPLDKDAFDTYNCGLYSDWILQMLSGVYIRNGLRDLCFFSCHKTREECDLEVVALKLGDNNPLGHCGHLKKQFLEPPIQFCLLSCYFFFPMSVLLMIFIMSF